ncbi:MAG TPA: FUSC family protein [Verrucomicrobiota bacterium]|nr:hypothetical protein [Verrucomicrobiales bacterium]HRI14092.1 FUSC family protein [Verrucomicrobiota bacterium]
MSQATNISSVRWENRLFNFLRDELAPSPTRWRASIRLCALCAIGTAFITAYLIPGGQFMVLMLFLVGMGDAAAARATVVSNIVGTLAGGAFGLVVLVAFVDQPWMLFPTQAVVIASSMYLMRRTTAPFAMLFFAVSFVIVVPELFVSPDDAFYGGLRAVIFQACGIALGTLGQMLWWPENPVELLLTDLQESLRAVEVKCGRLSSVDGATSAEAVPVRDLRSSAARLGRQLDLLRQAEARDQWLRQRHTEQIKLITDIQLLVFAALELERRALTEGPAMFAGDVPARLETIRDECQRLRRAIEQRQPPGPRSVGNARTPAIRTPPQAPWPELDELERLLSVVPESLTFLAVVKEPVSAAPTREPIARRGFFNPVSPAVNQEAIRFGLKVALAASLCGLLYQGLDWPGIGTCVLTTVLVAQATVGSGLHKSALRFGGALLAGLAVLVVIGGLMPNMQSLASLLVVSAGLNFVASWIGSGSSRTAYLGAQMGITLYLVLLPGFGPTLELEPARDRLIGILLGIAVMSVVDASLWPVFTRTALRRKLAGILREMAEVHRGTCLGSATDASLRSLEIHRSIAEALTLQEELIFETTAGDVPAETERRVVMRALNRLQEVFLGVLALGRERLAVHGTGSSNRTGNDDHRITQRLELLASILDGQPAVPKRDSSGEPIPASAGVSLPSDAANSHPESGLHNDEELIRRLSDSLSALEHDIRPVIASASQSALVTPGLQRGSVTP